jgi:hypothetical protein
MAQNLTQIRCPNCSNPIQAPIHHLIDVDQNPAAKAELLSGSLNAAQCSVCGYQGQIATPLVYHDAEKELLLTFTPMEIDMPKNDQERLIGQLINQAINNLPPEKRKGYLFQPQTALTMQGMVERILQADGITPEQIEAQRSKLRVFEELLKTPEEGVEAFITEHDDELDENFFQLASLSLQAAPQGAALEMANQRLESALQFSTFGKTLQAREQEFQAASESLRALEQPLTREALLQVILEAPTSDRVDAIAQLARPGLDYSFFQMLSEQIDAAEGEEKDRLGLLRSQLLDVTQKVDDAAQARAAQTATLLQSILEAPDMGQAVDQALPMIDELFLSILQANLRAANERDEHEAVAQLTKLDETIQSRIRQSLPPGIQLAQRALEAKSPEEASAILEASVEQIDEQMLSALLTTSQRLEESGDTTTAARMKDLHREALRLSMKSKFNA